MSEILFRQYTHASASPELTAALVECFREVFATKPWSEWKTCPACNKRWGKEDEADLVSLGFRHCDQEIVDYWPVERVHEDLKHEVTDDASCWLAFDGDQLIGFCWGYPISMEALEQKLEIGIAHEIRKRFGVRTRIAYQDELGMVVSHRGRGHAKKLMNLRNADFVKQNLQMGVVRTRQFPEPSDTFTWYTTKLGYKIVARYPNDDGRVILARDLPYLDRLLM